MENEIKELINDLERQLDKYYNTDSQEPFEITLFEKQAVSIIKILKSQLAHNESCKHPEL